MSVRNTEAASFHGISNKNRRRALAREANRLCRVGVGAGVGVGVRVEGISRLKVSTRSNDAILADSGLYSSNNAYTVALCCSVSNDEQAMRYKHAPRTVKGRRARQYRVQCLGVMSVRLTER